MYLGDAECLAYLHVTEPVEGITRSLNDPNIPRPVHSPNRVRNLLFSGALPPGLSALAAGTALLDGHGPSGTPLGPGGGASSGGSGGTPGTATDPGRVTLHRLNRAEYNNTVRDLLA